LYGCDRYRMTMRGYEEVPAHAQAKIVAAHKAAKEKEGAPAPRLTVPPVTKRPRSS